MMIWYMMVWYMMMIRKYPWWREMHGNCTTRWVETKRFLKRCSSVCWSSDVKSQSDKFGFAAPYFEKHPFMVGSITIPFVGWVPYHCTHFVVFPWFSPNFLRSQLAISYLIPVHLGAGAASDWKLSFSEHGRHEALVYRRRYLFSSGTTKMLSTGIPGFRQCWENDEKKDEAEICGGDFLRYLIIRFISDWDVFNAVESYRAEYEVVYGPNIDMYIDRQSETMDGIFPNP